LRICCRTCVGRACRLASLRHKSGKVLHIVTFIWYAYQDNRVSLNTNKFSSSSSSSSRALTFQIFCQAATSWGMTNLDGLYLSHADFSCKGPEIGGGGAVSAAGGGGQVSATRNSLSSLDDSNSSLQHLSAVLVRQCSLRCLSVPQVKCLNPKP
jgi:hypothetical protein